MSGLLQLDHVFAGAEARLFHGGPPAFIMTLVKTLDRKMEYGGGIKPFAYSCEPWAWGTFKLHIEEAPASLGTTAIRKLLNFRRSEPQRRK